jgi:hypothetical protein
MVLQSSSVREYEAGFAGVTQTASSFDVTIDVSSAVM